MQAKNNNQEYSENLDDLFDFSSFFGTQNFKRGDFSKKVKEQRQQNLREMGILDEMQNDLISKNAE